ncbi:MAG: flagellar basal body L-ring protein FlgH [Bdellovibrionales bacterium]|nr:flagellar basal body L-ring protein FlgH [Bdellovibrionales bacterium]
MNIIYVKVRTQCIIGIMLIGTFACTGCSSFGKKLKAFLGGKETSENKTARNSSGTKFSDNPNMFSGPRRQYKRVTKQSLSDEALLSSQAGSLWVMEGQGGYLFAQNIVRMIGDPIAIILEGDPKDQLQAKADIIKKLWSKFEERQIKSRALASNVVEGNKDNPAKKKEEANKQESNAADKTNSATVTDVKADFNVKNVPTRVIERTVDGNYRVKGSQPLMIGPREYKVLITGIVRAEDFSDEGIPAAKLLDAKYDIVSLRSQELE